jgi:hypothetical protein
MLFDITLLKHSSVKLSGLCPPTKLNRSLETLFKVFPERFLNNVYCSVKVNRIGVGLGRVVRKVRQHPDDHEFESQQWQ